MSAFRNIVNGPLKSKLVELIRLKGPLSVADYMKIVLTNPESGFYMNDDVFGIKGHFTTSPEISQIFGEVMGVWILHEWKRFNCPKPLRLVEFGPGRGTLMSDITRTLNSFEQSRDNMLIRMIELSPKLTEIQKETLSKESNIIGHTKWCSHINGLEDEGDGFTAYIAHEYLDALPIYKFVKDPNTKKWRELLIDYDQNEQLRFCISRKPTITSQLLIPKDFDGEHIEICAEAAIQLDKVAKNLNASGKGCMLICDYGFEEEHKTNSEINSAVTSLKPVIHNRDTFRAFKNHNSWPPLKDPGEADLTADVDFGFIKRQLQDKALMFGSVKQGEFLVNCGAQVRLKTLLDKTHDEDTKKLLSSEADMIINEMGQRYRFLALFPKESGPLFEGDPPAGFGGQDRVKIDD